MKAKGIVAAAAAWMALAATSAQAAQTARACLMSDEAEALAVVLAPEAIRGTARVCAAALPAPGLLQGRSENLAARFEGEAAGAAPLALRAVGKLTGAELPDAALLQPFMQSIGAPLVTGKVKPDDCPMIDRALGYLEPLPARNLAALAVMLLQLTGNKQVPGDFNICPATTMTGR
jgi:hypothetical protein